MKSLLLFFSLASATVPIKSYSQTADHVDPVLPKPASVITADAPILSRPLLRAVASAATTTDLADVGTIRSEAGELVGALEIDPRRFGKPSAPPTETLSAQRDGEISSLRIPLNGALYDLELISQFVDAKFGFVVSTFTLTNVEGFARFVHSADGRLVGTISTPDGTFRLLPTQPGRQLAYRLPTEAVQGAGIRISGRRVPRALSKSRLERRHLQLERLSEMQPDVATSSETGGSFSARGANLGSLPALRVSPSAIEALLRTYAEFVPAADSIRVRIASQVLSNTGTAVRFEQIVHGIPVDLPNNLDITSAGQVQGIHIQLIDPARATGEPIIPQSQALEVASNALFERGLITPPVLSSARLSYVVNNPTHAQRASYTFFLKVGGNTQLARVDAHSGALMTLYPIAPAEAGFGIGVCTDKINNGYPNGPQNCNAGPETSVLWTKTAAQSTVQCTVPITGPNSACLKPEPLNAAQAIDAAENTLKKVEQTDAMLCCSQIGGADHRVDVVYQTDYVNSGPFYDWNSESIFSQRGNDALKSWESTTHEFGHHVLHKLNDGAANFPTLYSQPGQYFLSAFVESFADVFVAAVGMDNAPLQQFYGDPWKLGDGNPGAGFVRDFSASQNLSFANMTSSVPHENSRAISAFFRQVYATGGLTPQTFAEFLARVAKRIADDDMNGLDLIDMKGACLVAAAGNATLTAAINARFAEMYAPLGVGNGPPPVGVPPPAGTPEPPFPVTAVQAGGCINGRRSWRIDFNHVSGATYYTGYIKPATANYIADQALNTQNVFYAATSAQAYVFVASCNASGCGRTSMQVLISYYGDC